MYRFNRDNGMCLFYSTKSEEEKSMRDYKSLSPTRRDCKCHILFVPKRRQKLIYGLIRKHLGETFRDLAKRKGIVIEEGH